MVLMTWNDNVTAVRRCLCVARISSPTLSFCIYKCSFKRPCFWRSILIWFSHCFVIM